MMTSCQQCGSAIPDGRGTSRCPACRRGFTGARDEHSVLFSLADFAAATGPELPRAAAAPQRSRSDEGSGLIDIRAMQAALGGRAEPAPPRFDTPAPALSVAPPPTLGHPAAPAVPSQMPLYGLVAALMFALASLTAFVLSEPSAPPPSPRHTIPAPVVLVEAEKTEKIEAPETIEAPTAVEPVAKVAPSRPRPSHRPAPVAKPQAEVAKPQTPGKPATSDEDTMKCLLGSGACKVDRPAEPPRPSVAAPVASDLPERLSDTDITAGTGPAKARATGSCARLAKPGERVKIKLSIAGPTGTVLRATAEDDGGNPALAACCAGELEKASFKPVQRPQMGAIVTLKF